MVEEIGERLPLALLDGLAAIIAEAEMHGARSGEASSTRLMAAAAMGPSEGLPGMLASSTCKHCREARSTCCASTLAMAISSASKSP